MVESWEGSWGANDGAHSASICSSPPLWCVCTRRHNRHNGRSKTLTEPTRVYRNKQTNKTIVTLMDSLLITYLFLLLPCCQPRCQPFPCNRSLNGSAINNRPQPDLGLFVSEGITRRHDENFWESYRSSASIRKSLSYAYTDVPVPITSRWHSWTFSFLSLFSFKKNQR